MPTRAFPVSCKGVVVVDGRVLLARNERDEWELPGGKLEVGEQPEDCVAREISEESGWPVTTGPILDAWLYHIFEGRDVLIVTYGCHTNATSAPTVSSEHSELGLFTETEVAGLHMPDGYKRSVAAWFALLRQRPSRRCEQCGAMLSRHTPTAAVAPARPPPATTTPRLCRASAGSATSACSPTSPTGSRSPRTCSACPPTTPTTSPLWSNSPSPPCASPRSPASLAHSSPASNPALRRAVPTGTRCSSSPMAGSRWEPRSATSFPRSASRLPPDGRDGHGRSPPGSTTPRCRATCCACTATNSARPDTCPQRSRACRRLPR